MNCAETEILLADFLDGALHGEPKLAVELHLSECASCAELAADARQAVAFMERASLVEAPPDLVNRLLFEVTSGASRTAAKPSLWRRLFEPVLQPRMAMGMAMTMLSLAMLFRVVGIPERQLKPADLDPVKVWAAAENRVMRVWERGVKYYENLRVVYEIQSRLAEWSQEQNGGSQQPPAAPLDGGKK